MVQARPKEFAFDQAEAAIQLFEQPLNLELLFTAAETQSNALAQDLGLDVPAAADFHELRKPPSAPTIDDDPFSVALPFASERQLDDRAGFMERLGNAIADVHSDEDYFSVLIINIDNFSKVNTSYGYPTGDNLIQSLSRQIVRSMRFADHVAHIGGDCFGLLLPETQETGGKVVAERIRSLAKHENVSMGSLRINCSVSIGGITIIGIHDLPSAEQAWDELNEAVNNAKKRGRNRVLWV